MLRKSTVAKPTLPPRATRSFDRQAGYITTVIRKRTPAYLLSSERPANCGLHPELPDSERDPERPARLEQRAPIPVT